MLRFGLNYTAAIFWANCATSDVLKAAAPPSNPFTIRLVASAA